MTTDDPRWPRAAAWLAAGTEAVLAGTATADLVVLGVPAHRTSLSPTGAHRTPAAVRAALTRYSTWVPSAQVDLASLIVADLGDVAQPDDDRGEAEVTTTVGRAGVPLVALGGDNSITFAVARGARANGLVTLDAHHDLRDGRSNGSPVRRLVEAGLDGRRIAQVGIADFANSAFYSARAADLGITVVGRDHLETTPMSQVMAQSLDVAGGGDPDARIHVDLDVDVCDRAVAPACPASVPGGISAAALRTAARVAGADPRVVSLDLTEVDATADTADQRTVRLVALCLLEFAAGVAQRPR